MQNSTSGTDATNRRRCSSNFMDGILSDPKKWNDAVQSSVQETFEDDEAITRMDLGGGLMMVQSNQNSSQAAQNHRSQA